MFCKFRWIQLRIKNCRQSKWGKYNGGVVLHFRGSSLLRRVGNRPDGLRDFRRINSRNRGGGAVINATPLEEPKQTDSKKNCSDYKGFDLREKLQNAATLIKCGCRKKIFAKTMPNEFRMASSISRYKGTLTANPRPIIFH